MAKYTIELRKICDIYGREEVENWFKDYNINYFLTPTQIEQIEKFNVWSKDRLATKIVDHYFMREIGFETPALFKHYAHVYMQEIMERKLPKIYSLFLEYDPLSNVDYIETYERKISGTQQGQGTSNSNSSSSASGLNINNDTPQTRVNKQDLNSGAYASNVNQSDTSSNIEDETKTTSSGSSETTETYTHHMEGDNGVIVTNQYLVREYRELISAVDEEIILELNKLFMGLY